MVYGVGSGVGALSGQPSANVLNTLADWFTDDPGRFVLVLANFGSGKTYLLRELFLRLANLPTAPAPILIEMRDLQRAQTLDELIAQHLIRCQEDLYDRKKFGYMLENGLVALLFDGFDELAQRVRYDGATEHLKTLIQAARGKAKVVVTSRTHFFESDNQVKTTLMERAEAVETLRLCHIQPFDRGQVRQYLINLLKDESAAAERFRLICEVEDLSGLSQTPRMLSFIAELPAEQLREAKRRLGTINKGELYRLLLDRWLEYDVNRDRPPGGTQRRTWPSFSLA